MLLSLLASAPLAAQETPQFGGHLRVGYGYEPTSLDPIAGRSGGDQYFFRQIFDQLVDADQSGAPDASSSLATASEISENPHAITFTLREGVKFHDGTGFNADAVKKNIDRILDAATKATPRSNMAIISSVEVLGDYKVKFNLSGPWASGLALLADRGGAMSSPTAFTKLLQDYGWNPSGTGPFKIKEVVTGSFVRMVRNENYWGRDKAGNKLPYLDEITIEVIKDPTVLVSALKTGQIDIAVLPNREVDAFLADKNFNVEKMEGAGVASLLSFNPDIAPMNDINLRRAVAYAINPADINKAVYLGKAIVADSGMWPVNTLIYQSSPAHISYDLKKAKEALVAAGKLNGFELTILTFPDPLMQQTAEIMRAQLGRVGIKASVEVLALATATEKFFAAKVSPLYLTSWSRYPEPDIIASTNLKSGGYYNPSKQANAELDALIQQGASTYDQAKRKEIYAKINGIVLGQALWHPMLYTVAYVAAPKKIQNLNSLLAWDGKFSLKNIWIKQ
ncbi:ABC transporter substrate-binding protein [Bradyrhizobium sp. WSM1417]|uniref:ABC transporter substrate-binding protein n=1 Tax=Bradyrhizobium sp. WSM1417 TaxID=754500 RepID=UPI000486C080|nr:ABC transporter substrate-binding protein [Bradyrhizobium sp. WSM1417]